jgi:hypothetical protein
MVGKGKEFFMTKNNDCVGSYSVSGYTRSDGTQVSGYSEISVEWSRKK